MSYAGGDRPWARWVSGLLESEGFTVEFDEWDWAPGMDAIERMNAALTGADRVLTLWSPRYFDPASWATKELSAALHLSHARGSVLVPVVIEAVDVPPLLAPLIRIDISGRTEEDAARQLLAGLRGESGRGRRHPFPGPARSARVRFPGVLPPVWRVPPRNPHFTGRDALLERLHENLAPGETSLVHALHGLGGVGKTQLAVEYAFRYASEYDIVWWFEAEQPTLVPDQFALLAERLGLPAGLPGPEAVALVLDELRGRDRWLLVFDNVPGPADIAPFRPSAVSGRAIVTSRHPGWGAIGPRLEIDVLAREESVGLLRHRVPSMPREHAEELAIELGDLPLALAQAAGYIESSGVEHARYLALWRAHRERLLDRGNVSDHVLLDATWSVSLERLRNDAPAAVMLLELAAYLAPQPVPLRLIETAAAHGTGELSSVAGDELALEDALARLAAYSLVRRLRGGFVMHRLVQAAVRRSLTDLQRRERITQALSALRVAAPMEPLGAPETWPIWQTLLPHVSTLTTYVAGRQAGADADDAAWLLDRAATYLQARGEPAPARRFFERALSLSAATHGPDHPVVGARRGNLGLVLRDLGDLAGARENLERALELSEAALGPHDPDVATDRANLGLLLRDLGDTAGAREQLERALAITEAAYGPEHAAVGTYRGHLGMVLRDLGDLAGARRQVLRALEITEAASGPHHPYVGTVCGQLGLVLRDLGDLVGAREQFQRALACSEAAYGPDHPDVGIDRANLGLVLRELGDSQARERSSGAPSRSAKPPMAPSTPTSGPTAPTSAWCCATSVTSGRPRRVRARTEDRRSRPRPRRSGRRRPLRLSRHGAARPRRPRRAREHIHRALEIAKPLRAPLPVRERASAVPGRAAMKRQLRAYKSDRFNALNVVQRRSPLRSDAKETW